MIENLNLCLGCMRPKEDEGPCPFCGYDNNAPYLPSYLAPGTVLNDRYIVGKLLSYNGEGANYIAYDKVVNKRVTIREYMPDTLCNRVKGTSIISVNKNNLAQYKTFMSEFTELNKMLTKMRTLNHIVPALELFAENNTTYSVFEYCEGITLKQYLQDKAGELTWEETKAIMPPILTTLSLIHNAGIIHRGISPDTIIVTENDELKLTGFCISSERTANTELAPEIFGGYAAPEQYSSSNWHGTWTDVYGISAVLYRLLTGCMPIEAMSRIGNDNLSEPSLLNKNVPANVSKVIMQGLKLSGDMRIQTITELVTKLFEQPDYLDQGMSRSSTATIAIPKIKEKSDNDRISKKKAQKLNRLRTLIIVFVSTLFVLGLALFLTLYLTSDKGTDLASTKSASDISSEETFAVSDTEESVATETTVAVTIPPTYEIPNLVGKNFELIQNSPTYSDWLVFVPTLEYSEEHDKGEIFEQDIPAGKIVESGASIKIKVSRGSKLVVVPDYYGKTETEYLKLLDESGIKYDKLMQQSDDFVDGIVMNTSIEPGEKIDVSQGQILVVYVCKNS